MFYLKKKSYICFMNPKKIIQINLKDGRWSAKDASEFIENWKPNKNQ